MVGTTPAQLLLVEAHAPSATWLRDVVLPRCRDLRNTHAASLGEATALLAKGGFDVGLIELNLPDSQGLATLRAIREAAPNLAIVVLTRLADEEVAAVAIQSGAQEYILKDAVNYAVLDRAVRHAIQRKACEIELQQAHERALSQNRAKSEFLAQMSHEIRSPMTSVMGYADALTEGKASPEEMIEAARIIHRNAAHVLEVINEILDFSKIESRQMSVEHIPCSVARIIADVRDMTAPRASAKGLRFEIDWSPGVPQSIVSDPTKIRQALINLTSNAVKFTFKGEVRLGVSIDESPDREPMLVFRVRDTGIGMSEEQVQRLFTPYCQAEAWTTRQFGGTGLGLAISRSFARMLGGDVTVKSVVGSGSEFTATFAAGSLQGIPRLDRWEPPTGVDAQGLPLVEHIELSGRALLVEDGPDNQRFLSHVLRKAGIEVEVAGDGREGIDKAVDAWSDGNPHDVIIMDMIMPVMDGLEATRRLRAAGYKQPIIALTANALTEVEHQCLDAGCDAVATKPIARGKLLQLVSRWLSKSPLAFSDR